jgi:hypothetical protein
VTFISTLSSVADHGSANQTDEFYAKCLSVRSLPVSSFLEANAPIWPLPMTSMGEDKALMALGLPADERRQIQGLMLLGERSGLTEEQTVSRAINRLVADPPEKVGRMQRRTQTWLLRQGYEFCA